MQCPICGCQNPPDSLHCAGCGQALASGGDSIFHPPAPPLYAYVPNPSYPHYGYTPILLGDPARNWAGIAGLVCGIISLPCMLTGVGGIVFGLLGLIFGILGLKSTQRGLAIAGLVCGCIGLLVGLMYSALLLISLLGLASDSRQASLYGSFLCSPLLRARR